MSSRPLKVVYKGHLNHFLVIGNHCKTTGILDHSLRSGAYVTWIRPDNINSSCLQSLPSIDRLNIMKLDSLNNLNPTDLLQFNMILIESQHVECFNHVYEISQIARIPVFVLDSWELSQVWLEDCARDFDSGLHLSHSNCPFYTFNSNSSIMDLNESYISNIPNSPSDEGFHSWNSMDTTSRCASPSIRPKVYLVGAGPGDPNLLTVAARTLLESAKVVVADRLIPESILNLIKGELKIANKFQGNAHLAQEEIYEWCLKALEDGHDVIRLKGGDPFIFGRGGEEVLRFRKHGHQSIVIPGISSSFSGPLLSNIPLTHRGIANQILVTTGRNSDGSMPSIPNYDVNRTIVLLMSVHRLDEISNHLINCNYPKQTPLAIVERASMPDQRVTKLTIEEVANFDTSSIQQPALTVVGNVINALETNHCKYHYSN